VRNLTGAGARVNRWLKTGQLPRNIHRRRVLALSEAKGVFAGATLEAQEAAIEANRMSPDLVPAAVMAAQAHVAKNSSRAATRVIKKAWDVAPHPDLASAFAAIAPG
jgi:HemY protein